MPETFIGEKLELLYLDVGWQPHLCEAFAPVCRGPSPEGLDTAEASLRLRPGLRSRAVRGTFNYICKLLLRSDSYRH